MGGFFPLPYGGDDLTPSAPVPEKLSVPSGAHDKKSGFFQEYWKPLLGGAAVTGLCAKKCLSPRTADQVFASARGNARKTATRAPKQASNSAKESEPGSDDNTTMIAIGIVVIVVLVLV